TITLTNPNATLATSVAFSDSYPTNLVNATTCGAGTVTASPNGTSIPLSNGTIPANGNCTVTVSVVSNTAGSYTDTIAAGAVTSANANANAASASAILTVNPLPPTAAKSFSPASIVVSATSLLTVTLSNSGAVPITGAA